MLPFFATLVPFVAAPPHANAGSPIGHKVYGVVRSVAGARLIITDRSGKTLLVDVQDAHENLRLYSGRPVIVYFQSVETAGALRATAVWRTFPDAAHWPADR